MVAVSSSSTEWHRGSLAMLDSAWRASSLFRALQPLLSLKLWPRITYMLPNVPPSAEYERQLQPSLAMSSRNLQYSHSWIFAWSWKWMPASVPDGTMAMLSCRRSVLDVVRARLLLFEKGLESSDIILADGSPNSQQLPRPERPGCCRQPLITF